MPTQAVSVIVPVRDGAGTLRECVQALLDQEYPAGAFELLFVDNGSTDDSLEVLRSYEPGIGVLREPCRGVSAARNAGARAARFELLAFTDADCVPRPTWLRELVHTARQYPGAPMVGGPILARRPHTPVARFAERLFDQERAITAARIPYVITANLCIRRSILESAAMFDVTMPRGQDVDLSYRVSARYPELFAFAEHAVVEHWNPDTLGALFRKGLQHGRSVGLLADRHAELLGETALARLSSLPRYTRIAAGLGAFSLSLVERLVGASRGLEHEWRDPLYDAVFNGGKQLGVAAHLMSKAWGREPE